MRTFRTPSPTFCRKRNRFHDTLGASSALSHLLVLDLTRLRADLPPISGRVRRLAVVAYTIVVMPDASVSLRSTTTFSET
jgi:hypothetical protein